MTAQGSTRTNSNLNTNMNTQVLKGKGSLRSFTPVRQEKNREIQEYKVVSR